MTNPTKTRRECKVCGGGLDDRPVRAREMMFGLREEFDYLCCTGCGCLQIAEIPADIARYYPADYYSFNAGGDTDDGFTGDDLKMRLRRHVTNLRVRGDGPVKKLALKFPKGAPLPLWFGTLARPLKTSSRILDVGCGSGADLLKLRHCGFTDLTGADPYVEKPRTYKGNVRILKCHVSGIHEQFDLVMLHHVLEHMDDPVSVLKSLARLLKPGGQILIRIPLYDSEAAAQYGVNWYQLDAPRHFFLHTRRSMKSGAEQAGLKILKVVYDSSAAQFWASEQYARNIPLTSPDSHMKRPAESLFSPKQIQRFARTAHELNLKEKGDQACFILAAK